MNNTRAKHSRTASLSALTLLLGTIAALAVLSTNRPRDGSDRSGQTGRDASPLSLGARVHLGTVENGRLVDFSPDGSILAVAAEGTWTSVGPIRLWDVRSRRELTPVGDGWSHLETIRFSPDSTLVAAHDKRRGMGVWEARTAVQRDAFKPPTIYENAVSFWFSPDSKSLLFRHYGEKFPEESEFKIRDIGAGRDRASITAEPWRFVFSADGSRVAAGVTSSRGQRGRVMLWSWAAGKEPSLIRDYPVSADHLALSRDLATYATANDSQPTRSESTIQIIDTDTGRPRLTFTHADEETHIQEISFSHAGNLLIANSGGGSQWAWTTRSTVWDITGPVARAIGSYPTEPAISPDGRLLAVRDESSVKLVDAATGRERGHLTKAGDTVSWGYGSFPPHTSYPSVTFSPDGRVVVVWRLYENVVGRGLAGITRVWQVEPLRELRVLESCRDLRFSPDSRALVTLEADGSLNLLPIH